MKFSIRLSTNAVRALCVNKQYYTNGTNENYNKMFAMVDDVDGAPANAYGFNRVADIARDIINHSNTARLCSEYGATVDELVNNCTFELLNDCAYYCID